MFRIAFDVAIQPLSRDDRRLMFVRGKLAIKVVDGAVLLPNSGVKRAQWLKLRRPDGTAGYRIAVHFTDGTYSEVTFRADGALDEFESCTPMLVAFDLYRFMGYAPHPEA